MLSTTPKQYNSNRLPLTRVHCRSRVFKTNVKKAPHNIMWNWCCWTRSCLLAPLKIQFLQLYYSKKIARIFFLLESIQKQNLPENWVLMQKMKQKFILAPPISWTFWTYYLTVFPDRWVDKTEVCSVVLFSSRWILPLISWAVIHQLKFVQRTPFF